MKEIGNWHDIYSTSIFIDDVNFEHKEIYSSLLKQQESRLFNNLLIKVRRMDFLQP
ncbi:hypothetical protein [Flavihumibacter sp. UBA7668]|uniref:hypothetical protein n=1 Tax=Flavihumibacter sp. UBA7668 TaxID=1946542 RepID=UPI0025B99085|nr:hypothetical protein [Flavihumibacter sp. UBA7668]